MANLKRLWLCLLLTGNLHVSNLVVATGAVPIPLNNQTSDPKQDDKGGDKDKDKDKDKKPKDDKPAEDKPKDDPNGKDDQNEGGEKDKDKDKAPNGGQDSGEPEPDQGGGNDDTNKDDKKDEKGKDDADKGKGEKDKDKKDEGKAKDKDKKPTSPDPAAPDQDGAPVNEGAPAQDNAAAPDATPNAPAPGGAGAAGVENAGVAPVENKVSPNPIGRTSSSNGRFFAGGVSVNDGSSILIGGTRLEGDSRWLNVLRAGMWVEAYGHWENDVFVTDDVVVREDDNWAYYRGPAAALGADAQGTVEAWTADGKDTFEGVRTAPDDGNAVRLVAYFDGQNLVAVPVSFPAPAPGPAGWLELKGYFDGEKVVWESAAPFP